VSPSGFRDHALAASLHARAALAALEATVYHLTELSRSIGVPATGFIESRRARRMLTSVCAKIDLLARTANRIANRVA
jgi:hypothetical protein